MGSPFTVRRGAAPPNAQAATRGMLQGETIRTGELSTLFTDSRIGQIAEAVVGIPGAVIDDIRARIDSIVGGLGNAAIDIEDLQDKTQELEGVHGYAATYMPPGANFVPGNSFSWLPFTAQVGPTVGTVIGADGGITMLSEGLWRADTQVFFSWEAVLGRIFVDICVFDEFGDLFAVREWQVETTTGSTSHYTANTNFTFAVPRPGFRVWVRARTAALGREIRTGLTNTSFTVNKWSSEPGPLGEG